MATIKYKGQNYKSLRNRLRSQHEKFFDPEFPAGTDWLRPTELVRRPRLITDGISGADAEAGERGSAWFATACSVLTARPHLIARVVPGYTRQDYGGNFHPGIFRFAFSRHGRVYEVVVDDRLPARDGRLLRCRSADGKEFWSALLEKAYAKLHGGYQTLYDGRIADAIASFGRGVPDYWDLRQLTAQVDVAGSPAAQERLARLLQFHVQRDGQLMFSLRPQSKQQQSGDVTPRNLVYGRGYLVSDVQQVGLLSGARVWLLRLQTARYEDRREWTGPWKDNGSEWRELDGESANRVSHWFHGDCIFWISLLDAVTHFTDLDMCLAPAGGLGGDGGAIGIGGLGLATLEGPWKGDSCEPLAGPQFLMEVKSDRHMTVTLCLEQGGPETACRPDLQADIGLDVVRAEENRRSRLRGAGTSSPGCLVARAAVRRQPGVTLCACVAPGSYVLLLRAAAGPVRPAGFTLRAISRFGVGLSLLPDVPPPLSGPCGPRLTATSRLVVERISGLAAWLGAGTGVADLKVKLLVSCPRSNVTDWQSRYYYADPERADCFLADLRLLICRYRLGEPVRVEVVHSHLGSYTRTPVGWASVAESPEPIGQDVALTDSQGQPIAVLLRCSLCTLEDVDEF